MKAKPMEHATHLSSLSDNLKETLSLLKIHRIAAGAGPGRKVGVEVLNKSAIVLAVASWEAYVEDTVGSALEFIISNAKDHTVLPKQVLERVGQKNQGIHAWRLAGDGWKGSLRDNLKEVLSSTTGKLNTPKPNQVNELFAKAIGLEKIATKWFWPGRSNASCVAALEKLIELRGSIAHRVTHSDKVWKKDVRDAVALIARIGAVTNNVTCDYVSGLVGKDPWMRVKWDGQLD